MIKTFMMKVLLLFFVFCAVQNEVLTGGGMQRLGGFREINLDIVSQDDKSTIDKSLVLAAKKMNEVKTNHGTNNAEPLKIVRLLNASYQIIQGKKYQLTFEVYIDGQVKVCTVYVAILNPWINGGDWSVEPARQPDSCSPYFQKSPPSKRSVPLIGGAHKVDTNDALVWEAAQWSVEHMNKMSNSLFMQALLKVTKATRQIINGLRYRFLLTTVFTSCRNVPENHHKTLEECPAAKNPKAQDCDVSVINSQGKYTMEDFKCKPHMETVDKDIQKRSAVANMKIFGGDTHDYLPHGEDKCAEHVSAFNEFKIKYDRLYGTPDEEAARFKIFCENMEKVKLIQAVEQGSAQYGATKFADLSEEEFKKSHLGFKPPVSQKRQWPQAKIPEGPIPESWDWRDHNAVSPVKNQGWCGSCWAFSTTGNIEGQWAVNSPSHQLLSLSEQELVDCDKLDQGCNGGFMYDAYEAIMELGGIETESDYKYTGKDQNCQFNRSEVVVKVTGAVNISKDEGEMAAWLFKNGPIAIGINSFAMQFYLWGIAHPWKFFCDPNALDHGVLIVGYGKKGNEPYWIIKNSWGPSWGRQGYYYIYRGDGSCGLNTMCSSAVVV